MARDFLRGNPKDRLSAALCRQCRPHLGAATTRGPVAMEELLACRRLTNPVGGDTTCQQEVAPYINVPGPAHEQAIYPTAMAPPNREPSDTGECLTAPHGGGATTATHPILDLLPFREIWVVDFEFGSKPGENPEPVCLVAWELKSGRKF